MKNLLIYLFVLCFPIHHGFCLEKLNSDYQIKFGNPKSKLQVTQYFSFTCPHCLGLFRKDFQEIKSEYIDSDKVYWVFHPIPMDLLTVQAMDCLEKLSEQDKRVFLIAILEVMPLDDSSLSLNYMQKAMEIFGKPIPNLSEKAYLSQTRAFQDAFHFIKQKEKINAVPVIEVNGELFLREVPSKEFIDNHFNSLLKE